MFSCDHCQYQDASYTMVKIHISSFHEDPKYGDHQVLHKGRLPRHKKFGQVAVQYSCKNCGHEASSKKNLHQHQSLVHEGLNEREKYSCRTETHCSSRPIKIITVMMNDNVYF